ncbi:hypothetical protein SAMN06265795_12439 [Noviherbaspirillum humi]|uniref:Uncharacterized protein n=1 Tax=Noviherbaspirillum humi TaxID=1688639 RepID=A0A239LLR7_9BURK|nr:hypothetical protein [Noviherbaspirillum humi]SNT31315.1 hypothetical protein SAMN06265795_12439 [Noviherbaspirillum humi]
MSRKAENAEKAEKAQHLAQVEQRIAEEEERLMLQRQRIAEARAMGWPTEEHEVLLSIMQNKLHDMQVQRRPLMPKQKGAH